MGKMRYVYFADLALNVQNRILEGFGADSPAELGLDKKPYAAVYEDSEGVGAIGLFEPA